MKIRNFIYNLIFWIAFIYSAWKILFVFAPDFTQIKIIWAGPIAGMAALFFAFLKLNEIVQKKIGTQKNSDLSNNIMSEAFAFIKKEFLVLLLISLLVFGLLFKFVGVPNAICYLFGAFASFVAGFAGMLISIKAESKAAGTMEESLQEMFKIASRGGFSNGLFIGGFSLLVLPILYFVYKDPAIICAFAFGAVSVSLFMKTGSAIFAKASSINTSLIENKNNVSDDEKTSFAVVSKNTADNADNVLSGISGALSTYSCLIIAAICLGTTILNLIGSFLPLTFLAMGIFCTILASLFVKIKENGNAFLAFKIGNIIAVILFVIIAAYLVEGVFLPEYHSVLYSVLIGVATGCLLCFVAQYYTKASFNPLKSVIEAKERGSAAAVLMSKQAGTKSTFISLLIISLTFLISFLIIGGMESYSGGVYGVALAAIGMYAVISMKSASSYFANIIKCSKRILGAEGVKGNEEVDKFENAGKSLRASNKIIDSAVSALSAALLTVSFALTVNVPEIDILNPFVMSMVIFGACIPFFYRALIESSTCSVAKKALEKDEAGALLGLVGLMANKSILKSIVPFLFATIIPLIVCFLTAFLFGKELGVQSMGGFLMGAVATGACLSVVGAISSSVLENANETIPDAKDTASSSLNVFIQYMSAMALVLSGLFMS